MPPIDEETAQLREELGQLVDKIKTKQEEVRDDVSLGQPGSKYHFVSIIQLSRYAHVCFQAWENICEEVVEGTHQQSDLCPLQRRQQVN